MEDFIGLLVIGIILTIYSIIAFIKVFKMIGFRLSFWETDDWFVVGFLTVILFIATLVCLASHESYKEYHEIQLEKYHRVEEIKKATN